MSIETRGIDQCPTEKRKQATSLRHAERGGTRDAAAKHTDESTQLAQKIADVSRSRAGIGSCGQAEVSRSRRDICALARELVRKIADVLRQASEEVSRCAPLHDPIEVSPVNLATECMDSGGGSAV